jgi:hypothetical protein
MNRNDKSREIEARLHRSLINQVRAPRLDPRFDAGVWARIEAEASARALGPQPVMLKSKAEQWLVASNVIGLVVAAALVLFFGLRMFSGIEVSVPNIPAAKSQQIADLVTWVVTIASLVFGLMFTPLGRRLRSEFF